MQRVDFYMLKMEKIIGAPSVDGHINIEFV